MPACSVAGEGRRAEEGDGQVVSEAERLYHNSWIVRQELP